MASHTSGSPSAGPLRTYGAGKAWRACGRLPATLPDLRDGAHGPANLRLLRPLPGGKVAAPASALPRTEAQAIRASLTTALEAVWEAKATLEKYGRG